eukprot:gene6806-7575_t
MSSFYLKLLENPLKFPPVTEDNSVFFDEGNKEVFSVSRQKNVNEIKLRGIDASSNLNFQVPEKGHVISIKFSLDHRIIAIQRSLKSIDFVNFDNGKANGPEYSQSCKGRTTQIMGFIWTSINELVIVTNQGIELYQIQSDKRHVKLIKNYSVSVNWFVYLSESSVLLLSSGIMGNIIHPYTFRPGSVNRLPKFEVENPASTRTPQPGGLHVRDVTVANIYGQIYVVVLRNQPRVLNSVGAEIVLYQLQRDVPGKKSAVLKLGAVGRFAVNVVDNLIVVHHQASKTSMLFDVKLSGEYDGQISYFFPVLAPLPIQPQKIRESDSSCDDDSYKGSFYDLYSPNWIVFQPNIIIDAKLGCLWQVKVQLESMVNMIEDKGQLIDFLSLREDSKAVQLAVCNEMLAPERKASLGTISQIFDKLNSVYADFLQVCADNSGSDAGENLKDCDGGQRWSRGQSIVNQQDLYKHVFLHLTTNPSLNEKFVIGILIEYVRSLNYYQITANCNLHELIINILVEKKRYYQLHQLLQYNVLSDSEQLAFLLLGLEKKYPPTLQLALDMLKRLPTCSEKITEVLLSKQQVIPALKYLESIDAMDSASPRKFLETAMMLTDDLIFFAVYRYFQKRNIRLRKHPGFVPGEQCEIYEKHFNKLFGEKRFSSDLDGLVDIVEGLHY